LIVKAFTGGGEPAFGLRGPGPAGLISFKNGGGVTIEIGPGES
jgi:hypothetical protein